MSEYHIPVLLKESIDALNIQENGIYVDLTFGGGGHSKEILSRLSPNGKLFSFDQDEDAKIESEKIEAPNFQFVAANFRYLRKYLKLYQVKVVDGILADLGVSSHQFDTPERGFSTRFEAELDMRMNQSQSLTASDILKDYSEKELHKIFGMYGEIKNAKTLAQTLVRKRSEKAIETVDELKEIAFSIAPKHKEFKYFAQVFQALRIEVNQEMEALEEMLLATTKVLKPEGRLVVLSYHSLEDRLVKNIINSGNTRGELEKDFYGKVIKPLQTINRKPIIVSEEEVEQNPRARSVKMRIAEKI